MSHPDDGSHAATQSQGHQGAAINDPRNDPPRGTSSWPVLLLALPAFVAIWSGWVGLGTLTGFGVVQPLPGIWDGLRIDTRVTLPIGMEAYAAYALSVGLGQTATARAASFARRSAVGALILGAVGQVAYHLMSAAGLTRAPWPVTALVACLPVAVLGMGAALAHLTNNNGRVDGAGSVLDTETSSTRSRSVPLAEVAQAVSPSDRTDKTDKTLTVQANGGEFRQERAGDDVTEPDRTPVASRLGHPGSGVPVGERVRSLALTHPDVTRVELARLTGCSVRTVHRHLFTSATASRGRAAPPRQAVSAVADTDRPQELGGAA
jgi:hypothetical protein